MFKLLYKFMGFIIFMLVITKGAGTSHFDFQSIIWAAIAVVSLISLFIKKMIKYVAVLMIILCLYIVVF